jgi:GNAT superfamily N-acetyltransferase
LRNVHPGAAAEARCVRRPVAATDSEDFLGPQVRVASIADVPTLVTLMTEFYTESGFDLPSEAAGRTFGTVLTDERIGRIWLITSNGIPQGYVVVVFGFSMEYGGIRGFVDDFFVRPSARNRGLGGLALDTVKQSCAHLGVRVLLVETGPEDHPAHRLYRRAGYVTSGRVFLTQALARPLHEA